MTTEQELNEAIEQLRNEVQPGGNTRARVADLFVKFKGYVDASAAPVTPLTLSVTQAQATAYNGSNGSITATAGGGKAPYRYRVGTGEWSAPVAESATFHSFAAGPYTVEAVDSQGTVKSATITVRQAAPAMSPTTYVNDTNKTLDWNYHTHFQTFAAYELRVRTNGVFGSPFTATAKPQPINNSVTRNLGDIEIRIKATATHDASAWVANTEPITKTDPTYNQTLVSGQSADGVTLTALAGVQFKYNSPQPAGDPFPATMLLYAGSTQIGQVDFNLPYAGQVCAIVYEGITYHKTFVNGNLNILA